MTMALSAVGLPAAVLRRGGRLYAANSQFEKLIPDLARDRRDRLALADARADGVLGSALAQFAARGSTTVSVQSIPIPASDLHVAMILHVVPVRGSAHDVFSEMESLVVVTPVDRRAVPTAEVLRGLFDLTPAEARVAQGIGGGQGVDEIAARLGISRETVRVQLKAVLSKTGLNRQAQLSALLAGATIAN